MRARERKPGWTEHDSATVIIIIAATLVASFGWLLLSAMYAS
jgi:hypothetical protein